MGVIYYKGIAYGGGSDVVANPQDTATDNLEKVSIDGTVYDVTDADAVHTSDVGEPNGVAELDENGILLSSQLPSYVDDVLEYASLSAFPATGETGKIYVALDTNLTYRWSGSAYVEISPSLALGETSSTAYRGDRGKTAYDHATESGRSGAKSAGLYKIGVTAQGHVASATAVAKADLTALGVADQNDVDAIEEDIEGFKTVTGKYITVTDAAALLANEYELTLSPVQEGSGDPSPSNVRPIHGADEVGVRVCGKNLFDKSVPIMNGYISTSNGSWYPSNSGEKSVVSGVLRAGTYTISKKSTTRFRIALFDSIPSATGQLPLAFYEVSPQTLTSKTITTTQSGYLVIFIWNDTGETGTVQEVVDTVQIEVGSQATDYEPYVLHSTTITLPSTVYGGSVEMGGSGESKYRFKTFDGTEDWTWYAPSNSVLLANGLDYRKGTGETVWVPGLCNMVKTESSTGLLDYYITAGSLNSYTLQVAQIGQHFNIENSVDAWKAFLQENNMQLCYEMATPTDISVTPFPQTLLEGVNNVWAEMKENSTVIDNAQQSLSYQPQNIVGQLRQEINAKPDSFAQLSDTSFSNLSNGQIPKWNSTTSKWENANESGGGGASSLSQLSDVNLTSPADGQILKYDNATSKWVNAAEYSYTLPTASASTKGGIKVGDNLAMNGEVLSAKLPQWEKIWNYNSGATFSMPSGKTDIMLVIMVSLLVDNRAMSNVYPVEYPFSAALICSYEFDSALGSGTLAINVSTANTVTITNTSQFTSQVDFEIWVR